MTCWPRASEKAGATVRAVMSTLPLGGQGTTIFTARLGKILCAGTRCGGSHRQDGNPSFDHLPSPALRRNGGRDFRIPAWICWNMRVILLVYCRGRRSIPPV